MGDAADDRRGSGIDQKVQAKGPRGFARPQDGDPVGEGVAANAHLTSRAACPYPEGSESRQAWLDAWDAAERKAQTIW